MKFPNRPRWVPKRKPKTVFVFSGGAVRGAAQIGMLKALCEAGIKPDEIVGVSIGALNGFWFACDPTPARVEELERLWLDIVEDPQSVEMSCVGLHRYLEGNQALIQVRN